MTQQTPPLNYATPMAKTRSSYWIGVISLWAAIAGILLPIVILLIAHHLPRGRQISDGDVMLCLLLGVLLELTALGCGIVAWRTAAGKAGTIISGSSLLLCILFALGMTSMVVRSPVTTHTSSPSIVTNSSRPAILEIRHSPTTGQAGTP